MGLTTALRGAAEAAVVAFGDLTTAATYHSYGTSIYSPTAGTETESGGADTAVEKMLIVDYEYKEIDGEIIKKGDENALIPYNFLTTTPKEADYLTISGTIRQVQGVRYDPAKALWDLQVRKSE